MGAEQTALPRIAGAVVEDEPDEHLDVRVVLRDRQRLLGVGGLLCRRDAVRLAGLRLVPVLRDPYRHGAVEELLEVGLEVREGGERDVGVAHPLRGRQVRRRGVRVVRPGVELQPLHPREELGERPRGNGRAVPAQRLVAPARGRLADRHLGQWVARLDAGVRGLVELRVVRGADDRLADELRRQEELQVRLVPHRPERNRSVTVPAVVARREHLRERRQVGEPLRHHVRGLAAVGPLRSAADVNHHAEAVDRGPEDELVEIGEVVRRIVAVRGVRRLRRRKHRPGRRRVDDRRTGEARLAKIFAARRRPAERRIVEEADRHLGCGMNGCGRSGQERYER